jgi:hypothetical protein
LNKEKKRKRDWIEQREKDKEIRLNKEKKRKRDWIEQRGKEKKRLD